MSKRSPTKPVIDLTEDEPTKAILNIFSPSTTNSSDVAILRTVSEAVPVISSPAPSSHRRKQPAQSINEEVSVVKITKVLKKLKVHKEVHLIPSESVLTHTPSLAPDPTPSSAPKRCPICFDTLQNPSVTLCGHVYCTDCIATVARSTKQCPICRKKLTNKGFHPIFL